MTAVVTVRDALAQAQARGLDRVDAQRLLLHLVAPPQADRAWLITHDDHPLSPSVQALWQDALRRRLDDVPVAYLTGTKPFHGLTLRVTDQVLDPRPDTEVLVDWAWSLLVELPRARVLDLGTGSGAVVLALAAQAQAHFAATDAPTFEAVDASPSALQVAQANGQALQLAVTWQLSHWFREVQGQFDLLVSNPPYIAEGDPHLPALRHEPRQALVSGADGLDDLRELIEQAPGHLKANGWLLLEHGHDQASAVQALMRQRGFAQVQSRQDLAGIERCTGGQWPTVE